MSDLYATGMIGTLFIAASFFDFHAAQTINRRNIEIVSGVAGGVFQ